MQNNDLIQKAKSIIRSVISDERCKLFLFGSRACNLNRKFSDIDIGIEGPEKISMEILSKIEEKLEESDLPVSVDVVDFKRVSQGFSDIAKRSILYL